LTSFELVVIALRAIRSSRLLSANVQRLDHSAREMEISLAKRFKALLERGGQELFDDNRERMTCADLLETRPVIADDDLRRFFLGLDSGTLTIVRGARFNTLDRPLIGGRWGLLSRERRGCRYNAEYLSQIAAYVEAIHELGYPSSRVFFATLG